MACKEEEQNHTAVESDEDDDEAEVLGEMNNVQLGFAEVVSPATIFPFNDGNWHDWDGGKIGGKPLWLNKRDIPSSGSIVCGVCSLPMNFLLQIYCPLDDIAQAFHRALYVFCCKKKDCIAEHSPSSRSICTLRSQLPRENSVYPYDSQDKLHPLDQSDFAETCALCGCAGISRCGACKAVSYCSKDHQKLHWKQHKNVCAVAAHDAKVKVTPPMEEYIFPEYALEVEPEDIQVASTDENQAEIDAIMQQDNVWPDAMYVEGSTDEIDEEELDGPSDAEITQKNYCEALGNSAPDRVYSKFLHRIQLGGGNQVLRYSRWTGEPLLVSGRSTTIGEADIPHCEYCGAERRFEFQVLPQLLHYLQVDRSTNLLTAPIDDGINSSGIETDNTLADTVFSNSSGKDIDWGSIDVFTCTASCSGDGCSSYLTEFSLRQPPPDILSGPHVLGR